VSNICLSGASGHVHGLATDAACYTHCSASLDARCLECIALRSLNIHSVVGLRSFSDYRVCSVGLLPRLVSPCLPATNVFSYKLHMGIMISFCHEHLHIAFFCFFLLAFSCLLYFFVFICVYVLYFLCYHELVNKDLYFSFRL